MAKVTVDKGNGDKQEISMWCQCIDNKATKKEGKVVYGKLAYQGMNGKWALLKCTNCYRPYRIDTKPFSTEGIPSTKEKADKLRAKLNKGFESKVQKTKETEFMTLLDNPEFAKKVKAKLS